MGPPGAGRREPGPSGWHFNFRWEGVNYRLKEHKPVLCEATGVKDQQTDSVAQFPELVRGLRMPLGQQ